MITTDPRLPPNDGSQTFISRLLIRLTEVIREHSNEINKVTKYASSVPSSGSHSQGEFVWNTSPSESGSAGSKYVVLGWSCVTSGTPGTWKEIRGLTGG